MIYGDLEETKMNEVFYWSWEQEGSRWVELALNQIAANMVLVIFNIMCLILLMLGKVFWFPEVWWLNSEFTFAVKTDAEIKAAR